MMLSRDDIDVVYALMKTSERLGVVGAMLHDAVTVQEFVDVYRERQELFGDVLGRMRGDG
jgi:hypothetical protein